jgi:hypothetical protein
MELWRRQQNEAARFPAIVMAGLDPAIHVFFAAGKQDVDARVKPGHDEG